MSADIIKGPWKKGKRIKTPKVDKLAEDLAFADELTETLMINMIHAMGENGIDISGDTFIHSMGFTIESVKASIYKELGIAHPLTTMMQMLTEMKSSEEAYSQLNEKKLSEITEMIYGIEGDDDPEPEIS